VGWEPFAGETVVGDVRVLRGEVGRDLYAYLPPSHGSGQRFPVVYMHDGQNLFDAATSNTGEWRVDETMEALAREGREAVVVGIPHPGDLRGHEYAGEGAREYLSFIVETVKPLVESSFDVDVSTASTGIAGSSLGGVSSLYALYEYPELFGFAGVLSPAFWHGKDRWFDLVDERPAVPGKIYLDVGDDEGDGDERVRKLYVEGFERMHALLSSKGYGDDRLHAVLERGGTHHESAWARRLPAALRFLLP
jgi:predicted alpha/beta superfamily hydrolase